MIICYPKGSKFVYLHGRKDVEEYEMLTYPNIEVELLDVSEGVYIFQAPDKQACPWVPISQRDRGTILPEMKLTYKVRKIYDYDSEEQSLATTKLPRRYRDMLDDEFLRRAIEDGYADILFSPDEYTEEMVLSMVSHGYLVSRPQTCSHVSESRNSSSSKLPERFRTYEMYLESVKYNQRMLKLVPEIYREDIQRDLNL